MPPSDAWTGGSETCPQGPPVSSAGVLRVPARPPQSRRRGSSAGTRSPHCGWAVRALGLSRRVTPRLALRSFGAVPRTDRARSPVPPSRRTSLVVERQTRASSAHRWVDATQPTPNPSMPPPWGGARRTSRRGRAGRCRSVSPTPGLEPGGRRTSSGVETPKEVWPLNHDACSAPFLGRRLEEARQRERCPSSEDTPGAPAMRGRRSPLGAPGAGSGCAACPEEVGLRCCRVARPARRKLVFLVVGLRDLRGEGCVSCCRVALACAERVAFRAVGLRRVCAEGWIGVARDARFLPFRPSNP